ncbi:MAG: dihydroneopterin aldolase [Chitinophagaceae bacterium]|nr:dihydroneopterin aldolase [Chitinophagaceae bacterium]
MQVILKDLSLFGYHGVHPLEKKVGTSFSMNITIDLAVNHQIISIEDTLDYARVYETVKREFDIVEDLLEVLLERIISSIQQLSKHITNIDITLEKLNAPIPGFKGKVGVRITKSFI